MLQNYLGVRVVSASEGPAPREPRPIASDRRRGIAARLRAAVALGDVGDIQRLARELAEGPGEEAAVGERINRMAADFDFASLNELTDSLAA
jgi:hypothetical protein